MAMENTVSSNFIGFCQLLRVFLIAAYPVCLWKCSKISNTFLFLFSTELLVIRAGIHKMLVRIANREDPDQTASSEAV